MSRIVHALALGSAIASAGSAVLIRQGLRGGSAYGGFWVNLAVGTLCAWIALAVTGRIGPLTPGGVALFVLAGLIGTVAGRLLRFMSIEKVGASVATAFNNLAPFISTGLAILILGERVTLPILAGTAVIVLGTVLLSTSGRRVGFRPKHLALPILSATCFGIVAILRKLGLGTIGPVPGFAINVTTAFVAITIFLAAAGHFGAAGTRGTLTFRGPSLACFIWAGLAENVGVFMLLAALNFGQVSVVAPLASTGPIWALVMSLLFLRGIETVNLRVVLGGLLTVVGVYLITALE
jgi:drug/metabolite transporter, DME family